MNVKDSPPVLFFMKAALAHVVYLYWSEWSWLRLRVQPLICPPSKHLHQIDGNFGRYHNKSNQIGPSIKSNNATFTKGKVTQTY